MPALATHDVDAAERLDALRRRRAPSTPRSHTSATTPTRARRRRSRRRPRRAARLVDVGQDQPGRRVAASALAVSAPMPRAAPVTRTTLPEEGVLRVTSHPSVTARASCLTLSHRISMVSPWARRSSSRRSRARTARATARRCGRASTSSSGCWSSRGSTPTTPQTGLEIELNLVDDEEEPAHAQHGGARGARRPRLPDRARTVQPRDQRRPQAAARARRRRLRRGRAQQPQRGRGGRQRGRRPPGDDRHPADAHRGAPRPRGAQRATRATSCSATRSSPPAARTSCSTSRGPERLRVTADSIAPEAACTSTQLHVQVSPEEFPAYWNASQAISSLQLAVGANSPYLLGKELWRETRIALFEQATDTRAEELKAQGVRPRVWFGERWITSIFDLFEENVRYFPALLPVISDEDPVAVLDGRRHAHPRRAAAAQRHDLPLEPADLRRRRRRAARPRGEPRAARRADRRRHDGQRRLLLRARAGAGRAGPAGVVADVVHRRGGELPRRRPGRHRRAGLLARRRAGAGHRARRTPAAAAGRPRAWSAGASTTRRPAELLDIIEQRCLTGRNGASWFVDQVHARSGEGDRHEVLRRVLGDYRQHMHDNEPVHTWD